ncbi:glycosyltransferase [uncultured Megamonas sp.]|uniref:glycosyltransferase n=1 Tax=uncultured Megamonas sp. TaxID=286140 RepID=UPI0026701265|nr:glycosyltransferase [uncultured Megamonas sp.]
MRKKIAWIIPDLYTGGMPRVLETLSNEFNKDDNYEQYNILLKKKDINFNVYGKLFSLEKEGKNLIKKIFIFIKRTYDFYKINKKYKFDYVVSFGMTANIINLLINKKGKTIITEHNVKSIENSIGKGLNKLIYNYVYNFLIKLLYNKADKIVTVSKYMGIDLIKNYGIKENKINTIYNGVDEKKIETLKLEPLSDEERKIFKNPVIINVGATSKQKGQWHLIKIMTELRKSIPNIQLVILGQGAYYNKLSNLVQSLDLQDSIHLMGVKSNPYKYMYNADLFVLTSLYEGFPNVLVEAMTVGLPVISVDCKSGPRELFQENCIKFQYINDIFLADYGILIPDMMNDGVEINGRIQKNDKILKEAILKIINDKNLQEKYRKRAICRSKKFTSSKMAKNYMNLF